MNENEILDDLPYEEHQVLSKEVIDSIVACAKYAKFFVIVSIAYDAIKFIINMMTISKYRDSIEGIYGSLAVYGFQSLIVALISLISLFFLWQFAKKGAMLDSYGEHEFVSALQSLKHYFVATLCIMILWKVIQFLGPFIGQFIAF